MISRISEPIRMITPAHQTRSLAIEEAMKSTMWTKAGETRRAFIGGSDARIISSDEAALIQLWREKRGEANPEDLSGNLVVQLGAATEELNRSWYERNTGRRVTDVQHRVRHSLFPGWWRPSTALWRRQDPSSNPNSCCRGRSPKRLLPKSIWPKYSTTCGSPT